MAAVKPAAIRNRPGIIFPLRKKDGAEFPGFPAAKPERIDREKYSRTAARRWFTFIVLTPERSFVKPVSTRVYRREKPEDISKIKTDRLAGLNDARIF
jgi:hypothetical protein